MAVRLRCPSCGRDLVAREAAVGERTTCPSCLAEVAVPESVQADRPEPRERGSSCPRCGRDVEAVWVSCPWCEEPLRGRDPGRYGRADLDVRRDRKATGALGIALAVIGGIGVAILGINAFALFAQGQFELMLYLAVGLLFLAGLTTLIVFFRSGGNPGADGVRRVVVGTLAMAGGLLTLTMCAGLAVGVFLFVVCLAGGGPRF